MCNNTIDIKRRLIMLTSSTTLLLAGCANYDKELADLNKQQDEGTIELCLNIGAGNDYHTRAPQDGEHGDGLRPEQWYEGKVQQIVVFYYNSADGINADNDTQVKKLAYVGNVPERAYYDDSTTGEDPNCDPNCPPADHYQLTIKLSHEDTDFYEFTTYDHFIAVTNMGDFNAAKLGELRNKIVETPWTPGATFSEYKNFVMSNEHESFYASGDGTKDNPHKVIVTIERVAARMDFVFDPSETKEVTVNPGGGDVDVLQYKAEDNHNGGPVEQYGTVNLTHVRPFNVMQAKSNQGSYLIKRSSTPNNSTDYSFLTPEQAYNATAPGDFPLVVDPTTWAKGVSDALGDWYGTTRSEKVNATYAANPAYKVHHKTGGIHGFAGGLSTDEYGYKYYVLDYVNENTMPADKSLHEYATGYILRAVYKPTTVYEGERDAEHNLTSITPTSYSLGKTFYRYRPLVTEFDESLSRYFIDEDDARDYGEMQLRATGIPFVVETYEKGVCYYHAYARHDNSGGSAGVTPMEFGIVRNNIYRLKVSFSGPGFPDPDVTDDEPLGIKPYIFTRPWYKVVHEEITI